MPPERDLREGYKPANTRSQKHASKTFECRKYYYSNPFDISFYFTHYICNDKSMKIF